MRNKQFKTAKFTCDGCEPFSCSVVVNFISKIGIEPPKHCLFGENQRNVRWEKPTPMLPVILFPIGTDGKCKKLSAKKMRELAAHIAKYYPEECK